MRDEAKVFGFCSRGRKPKVFAGEMGREGNKKKKKRAQVGKGAAKG